MSYTIFILFKLNTKIDLELTSFPSTISLLFSHFIICKYLKALRLETLGSTFAAPELTETSASLLRSRRLSDNSTNRSYKRGQSLFIEWALSQDIPLKTFNEVHLTNFLSEMFETRGYQHGTIRLFRSAVTHLNSNPSVLRSSEMVNTLVQSLAARAPPKPIHRPTVDLGPSLAAMKKIDTNSPSTLLSHIQQKLAFLLGMAAFLRPSDLHRIDFSSAVVESDSGRRFLSFTVSLRTSRFRVMSCCNVRLST
ncbi:hypothetical protein G6F20_013385 [Rhizopus arrhizus]|nr:hypothetical protein G6F20_013385 [Rhizopus arrhizus]